MYVVESASQYFSDYPTELFVISEPQIPSNDVFEPLIMRQSSDFKAPKT